jgi:hypothetical protein
MKFIEINEEGLEEKLFLKEIVGYKIENVLKFKFNKEEAIVNFLNLKAEYENEAVKFVKQKDRNFSFKRFKNKLDNPFYKKMEIIDDILNRIKILGDIVHSNLHILHYRIDANDNKENEILKKHTICTTYYRLRLIDIQSKTRYTIPLEFDTTIEARNYIKKIFGTKTSIKIVE